MANSTQLEELSNEIFCSIFDYFDAYDLFFAFSSLNSRISSILKLPRLHVIIHPTDIHYQMKFLCRHLKFYSDQVISLKIHDKIRDQANVVAYLFNRHSFINLRSCILYNIQSSAELKTTIKQLKKHRHIISFHIVQSQNIEEDKLCQSHAHLFSEMVLINTPSALRSATLRFHYDYPELMKSMIIETKLTYLHLMFYGTFDNVSIYSLLPVLRINSRLQHLGVIIQMSKMSDTNNGMK
jgi:hypothetical protein